MSLENALKEAEKRELDLVEVAPEADPVVAKILDYGKYKYQQEKKKKKQQTRRANTRPSRQQDSGSPSSGGQEG